MKLNADFTQRVLIHHEDTEWQDSPMAGVKRRMLDRIGDEVARATSFVSYAPGSRFSPHVHTGGEEFIILQGVFQDEHGDYPAGSYVRNPPESSHTPGSEPGCLMFVKLWQFKPEDRKHVRLDLAAESLAEQISPGVTAALLFEDDREQVRLHRLAPSSTVSLDASGGAELLVLEGGIREGADVLQSLDWLRVPMGGELVATAGSEGAVVWTKTGHLRFAQAPANPS